MKMLVLLVMMILTTSVVYAAQWTQQYSMKILDWGAWSNRTAGIQKNHGRIMDTSELKMMEDLTICMGDFETGGTVKNRWTPTK